MANSPARDLGVTDAALLVVGNIVGAGIFLVSPYVAQHAPSPGAFLASWLLGGVVALSGALCNGELGGLFPRSGGEYVYLREAYGPAFGFLSGWTAFWIGFPGSIAALAAGFGAAVADVTGAGAGAARAVAVAAIVLLTAVNSFGLRPGKWAVNVLAVAKLGAFAVLLVLGAAVTKVTLPVAHAAGGEGLLSGVALALIPVMFAYSGWNAATYVAGDMRDAGRGLGRALALGTAACVALYLAVNMTFLRAMSLGELATQSDPARLAAQRLGGPSAGSLLGPLVALCILSSLQATVLVGPHIYRAMSLDGVFFRWLARDDRRTRAPVAALLAQGAIALAQLLTNRFDQLVTFVMFALIAFSSLTVAAVPVLRVRRPTAPRPFVVPGYPLVPVLFLAVNAWVLWNVALHGVRDALIGAGIVATGIPAYYFFKARSGAEGVAT